MRETTHIYELVKLLYKLPQYGEDLLALFLCTRLAMKNRQATQSLIEFIDDDDAEFGISLIYMQFEMGKTIKTVQHFCGMTEYIGIFIFPKKKKLNFSKKKLSGFAFSVLRYYVLSRTY